MATLKRWTDFQAVAETMAMSPVPLTAHTLPQLTLVEVAKSPAPMGLFAVDGALLVSERDRIGRIVGNTVQWFATVGTTPLRAVGDLALCGKARSRWAALGREGDRVRA